MLVNYRNPEAIKSTEPTNDGFTMIEILIVIVVLGILAAVVIFAVGGITGKTAVASCQADGSTIETAMAAFENQNPEVTITTSNITGTALGGPYIQSWPNNLPHYQFKITTAGALQVSTGPIAGQVSAGSPYVAYSGPSSCAAVL
jgi:general secretion pathway protein G